MLRVTPDGLASHPLGEGGRGEKGKGAEAKILLLLASEINLDKLRPESFLTCMPINPIVNYFVPKYQIWVWFHLKRSFHFDVILFPGCFRFVGPGEASKISWCNP